MRGVFGVQGAPGGRRRRVRWVCAGGRTHCNTTCLARAAAAARDPPPPPRCVLAALVQLHASLPHGARTHKQPPTRQLVVRGHLRQRHKVRHAGVAAACRLLRFCTRCLAAAPRQQNAQQQRQRLPAAPVHCAAPVLEPPCTASMVHGARSPSRAVPASCCSCGWTRRGGWLWGWCSGLCKRLTVLAASGV
jgi:hypothetical protein